MRKASLILFLIGITFTSGLCQWVITPLARSVPKVHKNTNARTQAMTPMVLPFWDDFSFSNSGYYPHDTLWEYGKSVTINYGQAIKPPSLGVATFNGLDSLGRPYNVNDAFAKGFADKLVSRPINLDAVPVPLKTSVFISFMLEAKGNGETPDPTDFFQLEFKNRTGSWQVDTIFYNNGTIRTDTFYTAIRAVDTSLFQSNFQFRFRSFGRLSGPYDTWHLDYVYVNSGRTKSDLAFPDRTLSSPLTSLFQEYFSIPKKHFMTNVAGNLTTPSFDMFNMNNPPQILSFDYGAEVLTFSGGSSTSSGYIHIEDSTALLTIDGKSFKKGTATKEPLVSLFDPAADSFLIKLRLNLNTKDNIVASPSDPLGDYDPAKYAPIDFRVNDTIRSQQVLSSYYAYDDGSAEYGIGLNQPGTRAAYFFEMKTPNPDTIVAVDIYFPRFGDGTNQIVELDILRDTMDSQFSILHKEFINVQRTQMDTLHRYQLSTNTTGVQGGFYVSWRQNAAVNIPVGWDANTDSYDKIFFNLNGHWEKNTTAHGSMMIRPVFGKGAAVTTGLVEVSEPVVAYPNPNAGAFLLTGHPEQIHISDMAGSTVPFSTEQAEQQTRVEMTNVRAGLYLISTVRNGKTYHQKILIKP